MTTYYVDFAAGDDTADGLATTTPWKTIPGTKNSTGTADESTDWGTGTVNLSTKVPAGTIIRLKGGTTHDSTNGGYVAISGGASGYYASDATAGNPITIDVDTGWGVGVVTFDAAGFSYSPEPGIGCLVVQTNGIKIDGSVTDGIVVQNTKKSGITVKERGLTESFDSLVRRVKFFNNGTGNTTDTEGAGGGQYQLRRGTGHAVDLCTFDGNQQFINGCLVGNDDWRVGCAVTDCTSHNHKGEDDSGIGFKAQNGFPVTFNDCLSYNNYKGWDCGEQDADANSDGDLLVKVINCEARGNTFGINFNCSGETGYPGVAKFYAINNLIRDNTWNGSRVYAGVYEFYCVHNVYENNGTTASGDRAQLVVQSDGESDQTNIKAFIYNNIFYKPNGKWNYLNNYLGPVVDFNLDSDFNSWVQRAAENFASWSHSTGVPNDLAAVYGVNGPGHKSGDWYDNEDNEGPGTGHLNCDGNSKGTGAVDTTEPSFTDVAGHDFSLTESYPGADLSLKSWYIAEMGLDRNGDSRENWDMGSFEFSTFAATYYVDFTDGLDTNAGTLAAPWKTIPGTRNTGDTDWESTAWGAIDSGNKIPAGVAINLKPGTTHDSTNGGQVLIDSTYYDDGTAPDRITIKAYPSWAPGVVTFDGTSIVSLHATHKGIIVVNREGVTIDGVATDGIVIQDGVNDGIDVFESVGLCVFRDLKFVGNGTSYGTDAAGRDHGQIDINGGGADYTIERCEFDGTGTTFSNGIIFGRQTAAAGATGVVLTDCFSHDHPGGTRTGNGIKGYNSQAVMTGGQLSDNNNYGAYVLDEASSDVVISYEFNGVLFQDNVYGILFSSQDLVRTSVNKVTVINSVFVGNTKFAVSVRGGPVDIAVIHNVFNENGAPSSAGTLSVGPSAVTDEHEVNAYIYNNIFYHSGGKRQITVDYIGDGTGGSDTDMNYYADYNSYVQDPVDLEDFSAWSLLGAAQTGGSAFDYGVDGPGHASGDWYDNAGESGSNGDGRVSPDANSVGTGADDTTAPNFTDIGAGDYSILDTYAGVDLATLAPSWYTSAMGIDRNGVTRFEWSMGSYESAAPVSSTTSSVLESPSAVNVTISGQLEALGQPSGVTSGQLEAAGFSTTGTSGQLEAAGVETAVTSGQSEAGHGFTAENAGLLEAPGGIADLTSGQLESGRGITVVAPAGGTLEVLSIVTDDTSGQLEANFRGVALPPTMIDVPIKSHIYDEVGIRSHV